MCPHITSVSVAGVAALAFLAACRTTPLDVVYAVDAATIADGGADAGGPPDAASGGDAAAGGASAGSGGTGGSAGSDCSKVGPGRYVLRSRANGLYLGQGAPTSVFGNPGFLVDFSTDFHGDARAWQIVATAIPNVFSFQNLALPPPHFVLDVRMAAIADGTPVITFGENGYDNQRFEARARDASAYELRPQHHPQSCVAAMTSSAAATTSSAQISACDPADSTQAWLLQRSDCLQ